MVPEDLSIGDQHGDGTCALARAVSKFERTMSDGDYEEAGWFIEENPSMVRFGSSPKQFFQHLNTLMTELSAPGVTLQAYHRILNTRSADGLFSGKVLQGIKADGAHVRGAFIVERMRALRLRGHVRRAWELGQQVLPRLGTMIPIFDATEGADLNMTVQTGATAMMVGEFQEALRLFSQAQLQVGAPGFDFFRRDALIRSAMIHVCFGDAAASQGMLDRSEQVPRTSSWVEVQLDAQYQLATVLLEDDPQVARDILARLELHQLGELWPFYVIALDRVMRTGNYQYDLERRLEDFDTMSLAQVDGQGLSGSAIPLNRVLLAMDSGRHEKAQAQLKRADPQMSVTQLFAAAAHLHAGSPSKALKTAEILRDSVRGLRLLSLRRLAIIAASQHQQGKLDGSLAAVKQAMSLSRPLSRWEVRQFSPQVRALARSRIDGWNDDAALPSLFLNSVPDVGLSLSVRELEIMKHLAQGHSRAQMATELFVSVNTLKSQLRSIYRKLEVSSAAAAVREAERRGVL